jgi:hypothetical protein
LWIISSPLSLVVKPMNRYLVPAAVMFGVAVLLNFIQQRYDRAFAAPASRAGDAPLQWLRARLFVLAQRSRQLGILGCYAFLVSLIAAKLPLEAAQYFGYIGTTALAALLLGGLVYAVVSFRLRSDGCKRLLLWKMTRHPPYLRKGLETESLRTRAFQCMYCGQRYYW